MNLEPVCPHCHQKLGESIPRSIQGTVELVCPFCGMNYTFQKEDESMSTPSEQYLSSGLFRRRSISGSKLPSNDKSALFSCLIYFCVIPLIGMGVLLILMVILTLLGGIF